MIQNKKLKDPYRVLVIYFNFAQSISVAFFLHHALSYSKKNNVLILDNVGNQQAREQSVINTFQQSAVHETSVCIFGINNHTERLTKDKFLFALFFLFP